MTKHTTTPDVDRLLGQARWVEGFARALVREDSDDVAQDAWLAAIQRPPPGDSPRPWFATVMRNLRNMRFRGASRRRAREDASGDRDAQVPTPAELAHRLELQRRLATAVLGLEEPHRSTVVLVFYEGLSPADVAREHRIPATTVRSRLRAALVTLRAQLDLEEGGDRGRWHLALAPVVAPKLVPATAPLWPLAIAAFAVAATIGTAAVVASERTTESSPPEVVAPTWPPQLAVAQVPRPPTPARAVTTTTTAAAQQPLPPPFAAAEKTLMKHVDECYDIAHRAGRDLQGVVHMSISLIGADATVEVDGVRTTIADPELLECIRENAMAIEHDLELLRDGDTALTVQVARELPPRPDGAEVVQVSSTTDDAPACPDGTAIAGPGPRQWCALPDGTKHGPEWIVDADGRPRVVASHDRGVTGMELRGPEDD